jgi:tripartite-type tricarboxylate transporter receptor subunit TctC
MKMIMLRKLLTSLLALVIPVTAAAQTDKPMEWVVGYAAGGGSDVVARLLAGQMSKTLNRTIVVINKPGAASNIAADYVAKSKNVGDVVMTADSATLSTNPFLYSKLPYNAEKDFTPVGMIARFPLVLVVPPNAPATNLKEFLAWAKSQSGGISYGSPGTGSPHHLVSELFRELTGLVLNHVPYKGAAPALQDVMGGQVPFMFIDTSSGGSAIVGGKVKAIAVASGTRLKAMPNIPTLSEQGLPGFDAYAWQALVAPAATPPTSVTVLNKALVEALNSSEVKAKLEGLGIEPSPSSPREAADFARKERDRWGQVIHRAGIKLD